MWPSSSTFGAPATLSLVASTTISFPSNRLAASGTKLSLVPNRPVRTVTHSGSPLLSSR
jgi:hypothetical protein